MADPGERVDDGVHRSDPGPVGHPVLLTGEVVEPADDDRGGEDAPADDLSRWVEATSDEEPAAEPGPDREPAEAPTARWTDLPDRPQDGSADRGA